ncbi:MAG: hypothetical protein ABUL77_03725 [Bacteroidota bacterium]
MTKNNTYSLTAGLFTTTILALAAIGCGSDPNGGGTGSGGSGGGGGGAGGSTTPTLGAIVGAPVETFNAGIGGFILSNYVPTNTEVNLAGSGTATLMMTTLAHDATEGSPDPGCLKVTAPFTDWNQWVEVQASTQAPLLNWTGKKMHVRLKVGSGFGSDMYALNGAQALVDSTTAYVQVNAGKSIQLGNQWQEFVVDLSVATTAGFDASMIITYGIHIYSGAGNATAAKPTTAVLYIDSFSIE